MAVQKASLSPDAAAGEDRLGRLFAGLFRTDPGQPEEHQELCRRLADCADYQAVEALLQTATLDSRCRGLLTVGLQVLDEFFAQPAFHPELSRQLLASSGALLVPALERDGWLSRRRHPVHGLLDRVAELAAGWHPDHVQSRELVARMRDWFQQLGEGEDGERVVAAARSWIERFRARAGKLEERLREREKGALRLAYANREVARVINRQLAGRQLPASLARDLLEVWRPGLQWVLLNAGAGDELWNQAVRLLTLLFWSVQPASGDGRAGEKRRRVAAQVGRELPALLGRIFPEPGLSERMMDELQVIWLSLDHERPVDFVSVPPLETGSLLDHAGASVSRDLLGEIAGVSDRDWFHEGASGRRFRLLMKLEEYQQLLFVDQAGFKSGNTSFEDFAWQLTNGSVRAVASPAKASELLAERLNLMAQRFREERRSLRAQRAEAERERARQERENSERELAENRARREQAREREQQVLQEQAPQSVSAAEDPRRRKWARLLVSGLTLGTWLTLKIDEREIQRKLILILSSTDKYVLVGADGTERLEYARAELIRGVADGSISVPGHDQRYDDTLGRVVDGLQRKQAGA